MSHDGAILGRGSRRSLAIMAREAFVDTRRPGARTAAARGRYGDIIRERPHPLVPVDRDLAPAQVELCHMVECDGCGRQLVSAVTLPKGAKHYCGRGGACGTVSNGKPRVDHAEWVAKRRGERNAEV